jgi:hypothetical protein
MVSMHMQLHLRASNSDAAHGASARTRRGLQRVLHACVTCVCTSRQSRSSQQRRAYMWRILAHLQGGECSAEAATT